MKNTFIKALLIVGATAIGGQSALAANFNQNGATKGAMEMSIFGSATSTDPGGTSMQMLGFSIGRFLNNSIQIGGDIFAAGNESSLTNIVSANAKFHFHFRNPVILPYVGAKLGFALMTADQTTTDAWGNTSTTNTTESSVSYGANVGVKMFQAENVSTNLELFSESMDFGFGATTNSGLRVSISIFR